MLPEFAMAKSARLPPRRITCLADSRQEPRDLLTDARSLCVTIRHCSHEVDPGIDPGPPVFNGGVAEAPEVPSHAGFGYTRRRVPYTISEEMEQHLCRSRPDDGVG